MKKKATQKPQQSPWQQWARKPGIILGATVLLIACLVLTTSRFTHTNNPSTAPSPSQVKTSPATAMDKQPATEPPSPATTPQVSPRPTPFAITKVFFREYPPTPAGAEEGSCYAGQKITFNDTAEVTHTGTGQATYHWEIGDPMNETITKFGDEAITFSGSGVTKITKQLEFIVHDTSSATGIPSPAFQNRPHINLVFTRPSLIYANIENPVYAFQHSPNFIWGNYIMLCD